MIAWTGIVKKLLLLPRYTRFYDFLLSRVLWNSFAGYFMRFRCERGKRVLRRVTQWILWQTFYDFESLLELRFHFFWRLFITWLIFDVKIIKIKINIDTYKRYDNIMMVITIIINPLNSKQHPHTHIACKSLIFSHYNMSC